MNKSKDNLKLAYELKGKVESWVDRSFNSIHLEVVENMSEGLLFEYIRPQEGDEDYPDSNYPMWGTCFEFRYEPSEETIQAAIDAGFGVIEGLEPFNALLFVAGCGYSFYGAHWIPFFLSDYPDDKYKDVDYSMM